MATFQIHQDSEKENPHHNIIKEKPYIGGNGKASAALQSVGLADSVAGIAFKEKQQNRSNLAVLNGNANNVGRSKVGGTKTAFREVHAKVNDENAGFAATNTGVGGILVPAGTKKPSMVPVEQFKIFSVYEDQDENIQQQQLLQAQQKQQQQQQQQQTISRTYTEKSTTATIIADKENIYIEQQQRILIDVKREFGTNDDDYVLDTTPMSVSDVLSPMSVDRSQLGHLLDDSNSKKDAAEQGGEPVEKRKKDQLPRNDRQRFYEVIEYQHNILEYFRESEKNHRPKPHYMRRQADINYSMRTILVDWLVEVSEEYNLDTETLYLSVSYIDRFLSHMAVVRSKLQLVGTAAMYIASKYEEIYPPDVSEFVFITDDTYTKAQVLRMEQIILKILCFDLCTPTAYVFINTYSVLLSDMTEQLKFLTQYICELSLLEADPYLRFHPSLISASAMALARYILDFPIWSPELETITAYRLEELKEVVLHLSKSHVGASALAQQAIQEKYKTDKYKNVSTEKGVQFTEEQFNEIVCKYNEIKAANADTDDENNKSLAAAETTTTTSHENVRRMISLMFN